jgi:hypothetical protein
MKLQRSASGKGKETLTVPNHQEMDVGTLRAIYRQASHYIPEGELFPHFYSQ